MSEHTIRRDQLPQLRKILEEIPFTGHRDPDNDDRVIVEVEPEYDHVVAKSIRRVSAAAPNDR